MESFQSPAVGSTTTNPYQSSQIVIDGMVVDPNTFTVDTYLKLVRQMDVATSTQFDHDAYKQADMLLQQFSKTHQAWSVTLQVLTMSGLSDKEYFNAANMLKNKMMYDFATLRQQDYSISFQVRDNLILIIKRMASEGQQKFLLNSLCTALAILIMHINENWQDFVEHISAEFSDNVDHATCLLLVLKYMAADCDNDSIVVEDSIRHNFFAFIDNIAPQVFEMIFNQWAHKLLAGGLGQVQRGATGAQLSSVAASGADDIETLKLQRLRSKLVDAFYNWIKLRLPDAVFQTMTTSYQALLQLVFAELENNQDENMENATNCVIQLIQLARKKEQFSSIKDLVVNQVQLLIGKVDLAVQNRDEEMGEQLTDIFVELGLGHIEQIISTQTLTIPQILLKLMVIPEIQSRRQVPFWKRFFKYIHQMQIEEEKQAKLQAFEPVLLGLLEQIVYQVRADEGIFEEFNYNFEDNEIFDDIFKARDDFGRLMKKIGRTCGGVTILRFYLETLKKAVAEAQQNQERIMSWSTIESILNCISELTPSLKSTDLPQLRDVVQLVFQLPSKWISLKRTGATLFSQISLLMEPLGEQVKEDVKLFIEYVISGLENKYLIISCARCFKQICFDHKKTMHVYISEIIEKVIPQPDASNWSNKREYEDLLDGISALIEHCPDSTQCETLIKKVIQPLIVPLLQKIKYIKQQTEKEGRRLKKGEINEVTLSHVQSYLYLIGDFLKGCQELSKRQTNPFVQIFEEIWLFVQDLISNFTHLDDIIEYAIRVVKSSQRILGRHFDRYLIQFLQIVVQGYELNHLPSFIYAVEFCLADYYQHREYESIFQDAYNHITQHTVTNVLTDFRGYEYNPEVAFDFFGLTLRTVKNCKRLFYGSPYIQAILNCWYLGLGIEHREAIQTHASFMAILISNLRSDLTLVGHVDSIGQISEEEFVKILEAFPDIHANELLVWKFLIEQGQQIIDRVLEIILQAPSRDATDYLVDILVSFSMNMPSASRRQWFTTAFQRIPGNILTEEEKHTYVQYLADSHKKKDGVRERFEIIAKRARNVSGRGRAR